MAKKDDKLEELQKHENPGGLFIPAGVITGMGVGFLTGNVPAGLMIGLGLGFLVFAIISTFRKS